MNYSEQFVRSNDLRPADAILLKKKFLGMVNHFAVYLGRDKYTNQPVFAANYKDGVQVLRKEEVNHFLQKLEPEKIDRFQGDEFERKGAIKRALSKIGRMDYNLISSNCEHYKNFVQNNNLYSKQVKNVGKTLLVAGTASAIIGGASKSGKAVGLGLLAVALGAIALSGAGDE